MQLRTLAVVMPAYNEAEGLPSFAREVLEAVRPLAPAVHLVVVNDRSTDDTSAVLAALRDELPELSVIDSAVNRGHGPTALAAYRAGLELNPDAVLHVDGDGQFVGEDLPRVIRALDDADVIHGVRGGRTDPWFRRALTACVGGAVALVVHERIPDVNTPLRAYRADALRRLLDAVAPDALVPHVQFSIAETRLGIRRKYVRVRSIPRRGSTETGTMWGAAQRKPKLPPKRLIVFSARAAREVWTHSIRRRPASAAPGAPSALSAGRVASASERIETSPSAGRVASAGERIETPRAEVESPDLDTVASRPTRSAESPDARSDGDTGPRASAS